MRFRFAGLGRFTRDPRPWLILFVLLTFWFLQVTTEHAHKTWASVALGGYVAALAISLHPRLRHLAALCAVLGAVVLPLAVLLVLGQGQPEVAVIREGGRNWLDNGTPYLASPTDLYDYRPYMPALFLFGTLPGPLGEPRIAATALLAAALIVTMRVFGPEDPVGRWTRRWQPQFLLVGSPLVALAVTSSFIDVPQTAFSLLAFAAMGRDRVKTSGALVGLTLAMKPTSLCVAFVLALVAYRRRGSRGLRRFSATAGLVMIGALVPVALVDLDGLWRDAICFPLGLTGPSSPAQTPFPGVLLRQGGFPIEGSIALVVCAGAVYALWCVKNATDDVVAAAGRAAAGLALAFLLVPYSRAGYLLLPVMIWLPIRLASQRSTEGVSPPTALNS
jgi:glycosyl transferase family 87